MADRSGETDSVAGHRVASSASNWTAPSASAIPLLEWRGPELPDLATWVWGVLYGSLALALFGAAARSRRQPRPAAALRFGSVGTIVVIMPALLASPCSVPAPAPSSDLGTHGEPVLFYVTDHLRSTTLTVDQAGVVRNRYLYAPFGDAAKAEGPSTRHRFTGEVVVAGSGGYLLGARVLDPETGRFLQPDPLVSQAYDPQAFNRYTYALNSPMNLIDPSGLSPVSAFGEGGGAGSEEGGDSFDGWGFDFTFWWGSQNTPTAGAPPAPSEATDVPMTGEEVPAEVIPGRIGPEPWGPGTVFESIDEAAVDALLYSGIRAASEGNEDKERGGTIYPVEGGYTYDEPILGRRSGVEIPLRTRDDAWFHTHPRRGHPLGDMINEDLSPDDELILRSIDPYHRPTYLRTPSGRIREFRYDRDSGAIIPRTLRCRRGVVC